MPCALLLLAQLLQLWQWLLQQRAAICAETQGTWHAQAAGAGVGARRALVLLLLQPGPQNGAALQEQGHGQRRIQSVRVTDVKTLSCVSCVGNSEGTCISTHAQGPMLQTACIQDSRELK